MSNLALVFLGIIALSALVQAAFLIGLAVQGHRLARRLDRLQARLDRDLQPSLDNLARVSRNASEVSDLAVLQARRVDELLASTAGKVEETTDTLRRLVLKPLGPLVDVVAFLKGVRRGLEVYQKLQGAEDERRGASRRYTEDEHLFI